MSELKLWIILLVHLVKYTTVHSHRSTRYIFNTKVASKFAQLRKEHYRFSYNPHQGYEPYWKSFEYTGTTKKGDTIRTTPDPGSIVLVCGEPCNVSYREIKHVCTHHTESNDMQGCWNENPKKCSGDPGDTFVNPYREFPSYCHYLAATCSSYTERYILLHVGKCRTIDEWFKPMMNPPDVLARLKNYPLLVTQTNTTKKL